MDTRVEDAGGSPPPPTLLPPCEQKVQLPVERSPKVRGVGRMTRAQGGRTPRWSGAFGFPGLEGATGSLAFAVYTAMWRRARGAGGHAGALGGGNATRPAATVPPRAHRSLPACPALRPGSAETVRLGVGFRTTSIFFGQKVLSHCIRTIQSW